MKITKLLAFTLLCAAIFVIGCHGGNKPDYPEDNDTDIVSDTDSDTADDADTSGNGTDNDTVPVSDSDNDNTPIDDEPRPHDDADSDPTDDADSDPTDDADSDPTDDADSDPTDDADSDPTDDADSDPTDDADSESGDHDSPIEEQEDPEVVCTGQKTCFDNYDMTSCPVSKGDQFFGQDAQYAEKGYCLKQIFDTTADLVTDRNTDLVWQRNLPSPYPGCTGSDGLLCSYSEAASYCNNLNYAGKTDWRLPTPKELGTIIDYGATNPALNSEKFPNTPGSLFWTSEAYDGEKQWAVDFLKGEITGKKISGSYAYVRCVRGESSLQDPLFTVSGTEEKIVKDSANNLTWTQSFGNNSTWENALAYCKNLEEYAGLSDWRLPNINELKTLINYSKTTPASDFEGMTPSATFWSSTSYSNDGTNAWIMSMEYGATTTRSKDKKFKVICVK